MALPAPAAPRRPAPRGSRVLRLAVLALPAFLVLMVIALFIARWWLAGYLRSDDFRRFLDAKISQPMRADAHLAPLQWQGSEVYSSGFTAEGHADSPFANLNADQIHADMNLRALWHRVWRVDTVTSERVAVTLASRPDNMPDSPASREPTPKPEAGGWLPNKVEIGEVRVADFSLDWPGEDRGKGGSFRGVQLTAHPGKDDGTWLIEGQGGKLAQEGLPAIRLDHASLKTTPKTVFFNQIVGQSDAGGRVELSGRQELGGGRALDLTATLDAVPVDSFLPKDWRAKLHGAASGQVHVTGSGADHNSWHSWGHIDLRDGHLEALPVLDQLAVFTTTASFRQTALQVGGADFDWTPKRTALSHLTLESAGLLRVEGDVVVENGQIEGRFKVGVARTALRWLAGAGSRVFNEPERGGYMWTSMRLSGPTDSPHEDLSPRLIAAVQQEAVDKVNKATGTVIDTAGSLLDLLRSK